MPLGNGDFGKATLASAEIRRINHLLGSALVSFDVEECNVLDDPTEEEELNDLLLEAECSTAQLDDSSESDGEFSSNESDLDL
jgi:hypothetical protein